MILTEVTHQSRVDKRIQTKDESCCTKWNDQLTFTVLLRTSIIRFDFYHNQLTMKTC